MVDVAAVMAGDVVALMATDLVGDARDRLLNHRVGAVPVLDTGGTLVGIVTDSDLTEEWDADLGVVDVMNSEVHTVTPDTPVSEAARLMIEHRIHHLVVLRRGEIVGIVSSFDLLRVVAGQVHDGTAGHSGQVHARVGDHIVIRGHAIGAAERRGTITEVRGADGGPPFMVRWLDQPHDEPHEVLFFPGSDADIEEADVPE